MYLAVSKPMDSRLRGNDGSLGGIGVKEVPLVVDAISALYRISEPNFVRLNAECHW